MKFLLIIFDSIIWAQKCLMVIIGLNVKSYFNSDNAKKNTYRVILFFNLFNNKQMQLYLKKINLIIFSSHPLYLQ